MTRITKDKSPEALAGKYAWYQIDNLIFTAIKYLTEYLDAILGADDQRDVVWINKTASHLYATRWRPDFCFVYISMSDVDSLNRHLRINKIGNIVVSASGQFQQFKKAHIDKLVNSPYDPEFIGKNVKIVHGPLEDFYGRVTGYSTDLHKYIISVKLLVSEVQVPHHIHEFQIIEEEGDNTKQVVEDFIMRKDG